MKRRHPGIELLRVMAAFLIVGCHVALVERTLMAQVFLYFCDAGVAVFAAISGFLMAESFLVGGEFGLIKYSWRRILRLLPIYVVWSFFYLVARVTFDGVIAGKGICVQFGQVEFWLKVTFDGAAACHLWFIIHLLYAQLICAVLWSFRGLRTPWFFLVAAAVCIGLATRPWGNLSYHFFRLSGFLLLGAWLRQIKVPLWNDRIRMIICCVGLILHVCCGSFCPRFVRDAMVVVPALLWALSVQNVSVGLRAISDKSMGIFLWHPFFAVGIAFGVARFVSAPYSCLAIGACWILAWVMAWVATMACDKLPFRKFIH